MKSVARVRSASDRDLPESPPFLPAVGTVWDRLPLGEIREAVEVGECYADGRASDGEQRSLHRWIPQPPRPPGRRGATADERVLPTEVPIAEE
jgi:hypothetical protein